MYIKDLAQAVDIPISTIRYYERKKLLTEEHFSRLDNNYRIYNEQAVERLQLIRAGQQAGITLSEMQAYIDDWEDNNLTDDDKRMFFNAKLAEIEDRLLGLQQVREYVLSKLEHLDNEDTQLAFNHPCEDIK
ncbi:MAG: MerR family transcriptional regulator [Chloroflexota bacterium]